MAQKITIEIDGERLEGFDNISASRCIEDLCGTYSFDAFSEKKIILPFSPTQKCSVYVEGSLFITGILDRVEHGYSVSAEGPVEHYYRLAGRDRTSMIVDNSIKGNANFDTPISLTDIIYSIIETFTVNRDIIVIEPEFTIPPFSNEELVAAKQGANAFEFLDHLARQRGVFLITNESGDIVIGSNERDKYTVKLLNEINGKNNNILAGSIATDYSERFHHYKISTQTNMCSNINATPEYNITGEYYDDDEHINLDKFLSLDGEISGNTTTNITRAEWEGRVRAARSKIYKISVVGFVAEYYPPAPLRFWEPNMLIDIKDDFLGVNDTLLTRTVNYRYSSTEGSITELELIDKDAYALGRD